MPLSNTVFYLSTTVIYTIYQRSMTALSEIKMIYFFDEMPGEGGGDDAAPEAPEMSGDEGGDEAPAGMPGEGEGGDDA